MGEGVPLHTHCPPGSSQAAQPFALAKPKKTTSGPGFDAVGVRVAVDVNIGVDVKMGVDVGTLVGVSVMVGESVGEADSVGVADMVDVACGVGVSVGDGVAVGPVAVAVGVSGPLVALAVNAAVGVVVGVSPP